ncbi:MAG: SDR family oxidoreductase [Candidatus Promineifilaceae bacterium]
MDLQLKGKVALVTAASKGLGQATAVALAREGAKLAISARSEAIEETAEQIRAVGGEVLTIRGDLTRQADIDSMIQQTLDAYGTIDILIINAGGPPPGNFLDLTVDHWETAVQLTLMSAVRLCYGVIPHMVENGGGSIVAIESITIKQPINNLILSNSIRLAVIGLLKSLSLEFGKHGIRINSVNPTFTHTGRVDQILQARAAASGTPVDEQMAGLAAAIPLGRIGTPEEFGRTVAWIASPAASFIHGTNLMFDGGSTANTV